jgi:hypothetical protein
MLGAFPVFDAVLRRIIQLLAPARALDLGAGDGKLGHLLAEQAPACLRVGVEADAVLVQRYGLATLYHALQVEDAGAWSRRRPAEVFDLVLLGHCLEQMPKSAGQDLLNALVCRSAWLVLVLGEFRAQPVVGDAIEAPPLSIWSERDLHWHDLWAWDNCRTTTLVVMRGYLPSALTLEHLLLHLNAADLPLRHFDGQEGVRPARLRLVEHRREVDYRHL